MKRLAICYKYGSGVEKDELIANYWYKKSDEQEDSSAQKVSDHFYDSITAINTFVDNLTEKLLKGSTSKNTTETELISTKSISDNQQMIQQLKLNYGLFLDGYNIQTSKQAILMEDGELNVNLYNGQPIVYIISGKSNFDNKIQPFDVFINFPIAEITYRGNLMESFLKSEDDEKSYELYGQLFARKTLIGGRLFLNLATSTQIDLFKSYITWLYNSVKYNTEIPINDLPVSHFLPSINTQDGILLNTPEKLTNWFSDLYQKNMFDIISYEDLIPVSQLKINPLSKETFETLVEKQPRVADFKEELSLEKWTENVVYVNLVRWIEDFHFLQGIIINKFYTMETSKKIAANFINIPIVKSSNNSYLEVIRPSKKVEEFLINSNIFSIKDMRAFPFVNVIRADDLSYGDCNFLVKFEQYEIHINMEHIKPSVEFEKAIQDALKSMKPFKALQGVFDEYGHMFPQKIILGISFRRNIKNTSLNISDKIGLKSPVFESLRSYLDDLNISYLLTRKGNVIEGNELSDLVQNLNDDLEIVELANVIPLYKILDEQQQRKIDTILNNNKQDIHRIITTGIADLKDLDNNNTEHYKRINIQPSLEDENYEVIGSIISKHNNSKLDETFLIKFRLYDFNGFSVMIKALKSTDINITECCILWMIIGIPSKLSIFSPKNRDLQVKYKESIILQPNKLIIETPIQLSQEYIVSINAYYSQTTYEPINIKLVEWSKNCIKFQIIESIYNDSNLNDSNSYIISDDDSDYQRELDNNSSTSIEPTAVNNINCNICILYSDSKTFKIDYNEEEYSLDLIGYRLSEENFNKNLFIEINENGKI
ncbi:hypothetical protein C1645_805361 [Glomus cerebriforme]|uniref:Uncharacterized protein n=1 Tax=Glomus cerebriforme TaxID=658196 RepID=A0A397T1D1_9GLOM|nr:hypothetical protein C1645_805361 [Glomus cerebriforme]